MCYCGDGLVETVVMTALPLYRLEYTLYRSALLARFLIPRIESRAQDMDGQSFVNPKL
jgi:hypothetical protein